MQLQKNWKKYSINAELKITLKICADFAYKSLFRSLDWDKYSFKINFIDRYTLLWTNYMEPFNS